MKEEQDPRQCPECGRLTCPSWLIDWMPGRPQAGWHLLSTIRREDCIDNYNMNFPPKDPSGEK